MRAQTPTDYAVGMGLFLTALVLVIGFLPTVFAPFEGGTGAQTVVAERSADRLADDILAVNATSPARLNTTCTDDFFDADGAAPTICRYDTDADALNDALGVDSSANVNVTIRDGSGVASLTDDGPTVDLAAGPEVGPNDAVSTRRTVLLDDEVHWLVVKVW